MTHLPQLGDVQSSCCRCVSSRSRSQLKVKYLTNKYYTLCRVRSITPLLMERLPSNLNGTFISTRGCAEPILPMCQLKVKVTVKGQILNNNYYTLCCVRSITPLLMNDFLQTWMAHSPQLGDVQSPCCPCASSRPRSQLKVKYLTNKYKSLCHVRSINPIPMEGFPWMYRAHVAHVSAQGQGHS